MSMQYGVDGNSDLHLLSLLKGFFESLKKEIISPAIILEKYSQSCLDMIYVICDAVNIDKSGIPRAENYLEEIDYLERVGKHFTTQNVVDSSDLALWDKVKTIYFGNPT
jgi:hypothetical protein